MGWLLKFKWIAGLAAAVAALFTFLFRRKSGPTDSEKRLQAAVNAEIRRRIEKDGERDVEDIRREINAERAALRDGGDDAFMERAREWARRAREADGPTGGD